MHRSTEIPWLTTVARAAPATPMRNWMMQRRSSPTLRQAENTRKNSGALLFPTDRRNTEAML